MIDDLLVDDSLDTNEPKANSINTNANGDISMDSIQLSGECSIYEITKLHQKIHNNWQAKTDLDLDVSEVTEVDPSFIQLLASCKKQADENNHLFELVSPSEPLLNKIKAMFMHDYFFSSETSDTTGN